jgi:cytochrome c biogenesis protein CcdA
MELGSGATPVMALLAALALGLRHATDPDHLTAVSTLVFGEEEQGPRKAGWLGLCWGLGHATTLVALGLPIVAFGLTLPARLGQLAELVIGVVIVALAVRLLWQWWRMKVHTHLHSHDGTPHLHAHVHGRGHANHGVPEHRHAHAMALGRSPLAAYGIGLVHGVGGSAAVGLLLVSAIPDRATSTTALLLFAAGTAVSMAVVSAAFAYVLARGTVQRQVSRIMPLFGAASLAFGIWYGLVALGSMMGLQG